MINLDKWIASNKLGLDAPNFFWCDSESCDDEILNKVKIMNPETQYLLVYLLGNFGWTFRVLTFD